MIKYIKRFNFSIIVFIAISLSFSLEISKIEALITNISETNNFFSNNSIVFHLQSNKIIRKDFLKIINNESNIMIQKNYIEDNGLKGQALYLSNRQNKYPNIIKGRYFKKEDFQNNNPVAVIGKDITDKTIKENGKEFFVINNLKYEVIGIMGNSDSPFNNKFLINLNSYLLSIDGIVDVNDFYQIECTDDNMNTKLKYLELSRQVKNVDSSSVLIQDNSRTIKDPTMDYIKYRSTYIIGVLIIFILNITSITSYYINKSEKEIGVLKALGIINNIIIKKIVFQYILVSFICFIIGIAIHYLIYKLFYTNYSYYKIHLGNIIGVIMCSVFIGLITSIVPTIKLLKIQPNELMKR